MQRMNRRDFLLSMATGIGGLACGKKRSVLRNTTAPADNRKPNILIILSDQLRASALGCMGNSFVRTPNIDKLASRGALFTNALACSPVCSPSRTQILTGKFTGPRGKRAPLGNLLYKLPLHETTIAEVLKQHGFATGYIGKWHVSPYGVERGDGFVPPGKARQGFDYWAAVEIPSSHYNAKYYRDTPDPIIAEGFSCSVETDLAMQYIKDKQKEPFFLMVSWNPPHDPYTPPAEHDLYDPSAIPLRPNVPKELAEEARRAIAGYYGLISAVDFNLGRLLETLDALHLSEQTIVFFVSDHGDMLFSQGVRTQDGPKRRPWSESAQVPYILSYPGTVEPGQARDALIGSVDVMPTLLGLVNVPVPEGVQGRDFSPLILGRPFEERESLFLHITARGRTTPFSSPWRGVRTKEWLYAVSGGIEGGDWLLHNVRNDPYEMNNLVHDPSHSKMKAEMKSLLDGWRKNVGDDLDLRQFYGKRT